MRSCTAMLMILERGFVVAYETTGDALVITITDQGKGLDPGHLPDPLAPENLMKGSGRGIFLIRAFMDEVKITEQATRDRNHTNQTY